jgi:penicillin-insensitive murein endopeptidase
MRYLFLLVLILPLTAPANSVCYGQTHHGSIEGAVRLPAEGDNFQVFSQLAYHLGRTHVHQQVARVMLAAYQELTLSHPETQFMYAETGWLRGGPFKPHKTHQNGLSVDFMVPVVRSGQSVHLPINAGNRWGYGIEFDDQGRYAGYHMDFSALAAHLKALHQQAVTAGIGIRKVYLDPRLQPAVLATADGEYLRQHINFNERQAWVRHDEHYHVDFAIDCEPMKP